MPKLATRVALAGTVLLLGFTMPPDPSRFLRQAWASAAVVEEPNRPPERPRATVDVRAAATTRTTHVAADGDLQKAIDDAQPGDRIELEPGATYRGPFRLPFKE